MLTCHMMLQVKRLRPGQLAGAVMDARIHTLYTCTKEAGVMPAEEVLHASAYRIISLLPGCILHVRMSNIEAGTPYRAGGGQAR